MGPGSASFNGCGALPTAVPPPLYFGQKIKGDAVELLFPAPRRCDLAKRDRKAPRATNRRPATTVVCARSAARARYACRARRLTGAARVLRRLRRLPLSPRCAGQPTFAAVLSPACTRTTSACITSIPCMVTWAPSGMRAAPAAKSWPGRPMPWMPRGG